MLREIRQKKSCIDIENKWLKNKGLHFCHLNIRYLYPKLDETKTLLHNQTNIDILCLCETFLHDRFSDDELKIDGYNFIRKDRQRHGGGLIISSPEPKAQGELLPSANVRRASCVVNNCFKRHVL